MIKNSKIINSIIGWLVIIIMFIMAICGFQHNNGTNVIVREKMQTENLNNLPQGNHKVYGHPKDCVSAYANYIKLPSDNKNKDSKNYYKNKIIIRKNFSKYNVINFPIKRYFDDFYLTNQESCFEKEVWNIDNKYFEDDLKLAMKQYLKANMVTEFAVFGSSKNAEVQKVVDKMMDYKVVQDKKILSYNKIIIPPRNENKYVMDENRANFNVFCVQIYEINYNKTNIHEQGMWWWKSNAWDWVENSLELKEQYYVYKYIKGSSVIGTYDYVKSGDKYIYSDDKLDDNILYI